MRYRLYMVLLAVLVVALAVCAMSGVRLLYTVILAVLALIDLILLYGAVSKPLKAVQNGIYLIREQDFGSRLRITGQPDADKVIALFNSMMDAMKAERLKSLEQNHFLSQLIDVSPMGVAVCDFDGNIVEHNRAWDKIVTPAVVERLNSVPQGAVETMRMAESQILRCSSLWFMDSGFRRRFYLVERLTDEIVEAEKQIFHRIVRTIGHEVNNSLGSVISVLDSLAGMNADDPFVHEVITGSRSSCDNLIKFVRGYADLVKLPAPAPVPVQLGEWLQQLMPTLSAMAPANVTVDLELPDRDSTVQLDAMLMERVVVNIVKNAVDSIDARPDGHILIKVGRNSFAVTDNGAGIAPEVAQKLFTPFFSTKRPDRGLGLMLIADILRGHKASFSLSTDSASRLTTFKISF